MGIHKIGVKSVAHGYLQGTKRNLQDGCRTCLNLIGCIGSHPGFFMGDGHKFSLFPVQYPWAIDTHGKTF